jgi:hypothetical protein
MTTPATIVRTCEYCDQPLPDDAHRARLYCNDECRDRAAVQRSLGRVPEIPEAGRRLAVEHGWPAGTCRDCGHPLLFGRMTGGKLAPLDPLPARAWNVPAERRYALHGDDIVWAVDIEDQALVLVIHKCAERPQLRVVMPSDA